MKNRKSLLAFICCIFSLITGYSQNFDWIYSTSYYGLGRAITCDSEGNVYAAGEFTINADFCDETITTPNNNQNIYLVKFDSEGSCIWVKNIGSTGYETCFGLACDEYDNVCITGMYEGTISLDNFEIASAGYFDLFLAKYNPSGECLWVISAGGESYFDHALTQDFDSENNIYITGCFDNTANFGDTTVSSGIPSGGNPNVEWGGETFIAKYSSDGDFVWVKHIPGTHHINRGHCLAITSDDRIFIAGKFEGDLYFENDTITSFGAFDAFHCMLDSDGNTLWAHAAGSTIDDKPTPSGIAIDDNDNIYVTGFFQDVANFNGTQITSNGAWDIYLAKYDADGNLVWIRNDGGNDNERAYGIAINDNKMLITGFMYGNSVYNNEVTLTSHGGLDILIACYSTDGDFFWADNHGSPEDDWAYHITADNHDGYYLTGFHYDNAVFGDTILHTGQYINAFLAKFQDSTIITRQENIADFQDVLSVYPNPASDGMIHLNKWNNTFADIILEVIDLNGKTKYLKNIGNRDEIDLGHLVPGVYFLKFSNNKFTHVEKLIIQ